MISFRTTVSKGTDSLAEFKHHGDVFFLFCFFLNAVNSGYAPTEKE